MEIKQYNKKGFLLPDSIKSMAAYHAKIMPDGKYLFRIHDCVTGVRLNGDLNDPEDIPDAVLKLRTLAKAANDYADFIQEHYVSKELCQKCKRRPATTTYSDLKVCQSCCDRLDREFDEEYR